MSTTISKSVSRAFALLELFRRERRPLTATAIETALGLPQASALVLARELATLGYLSFDRVARSYFPSARLGELAGWLSEVDLPARRLHDLVDEVARATCETTSLCCANGVHLQIERFALGTLPGSIVMQSGRAAPLPCSGAGRAVLATGSDIEAQRVIDEVRRREPRYRFDAAQAALDITTARRRGYLVTYDLMIPGVGAVALPLPREVTSGGFALVIGAPTPRVRSDATRLVRLCRGILQRRFAPPARLKATRKAAT